MSTRNVFDDPAAVNRPCVFPAASRARDAIVYRPLVTTPSKSASEYVHVPAPTFTLAPSHCGDDAPKFVPLK
ncbi:MAG: hypothetical protein FD129_1806 [bacterium]|nr:MAG: hypothetical protein FD129_1806 [bacterium]